VWYSSKVTYSITAPELSEVVIGQAHTQVASEMPDWKAVATLWDTMIAEGQTAQRQSTLTIA